MRIGDVKMPKWGYSVINELLDPEKTAKASGRELKISHKAAREVCKAIKGMMLNNAKLWLGIFLQKCLLVRDDEVIF